ncbi:MAG: phosphopantetheine adenylyltransferase [Gammaproteobacteria bacterium]
MRKLATALFALVGLINAFPVTGVLGAERLASLYGLAFTGADEMLLMRHRAVLLGLVGGLLLVAAWRPRLRVVAAILGLASMGSFLLLALPLHEQGPVVQRVFWVDVAATVMLMVALWMSRREAPHDG